MKNIFIGFVLLSNMIIAQTSFIKGEVINAVDQSPLIGATLFWEGTQTGTVTDIDGNFTLQKDSTSSVLIISYIGYQTRKLFIQDEKEIVIEMETDNELNSVVIKIEKPTTRIDFYNTIKLEEIGEKGLEKAACCDLSESFETNPSVDASFTDAVTGTKQIKLLGLSGPYALITTGNIPAASGNSALTGLTFIPGQWLSSIQLIKGTGSVVNGNQSIAGQINGEYKDPSGEPKLFLNLYGNSGTRTEFNLVKNFSINKSVNSGLFIQADNAFQAIDNNKDGFMDNQLGPKIVVMNTWQFENDNSKWNSKSGIKFDFSDKQSGQLPTTPNRYIFNNQQQKLSAWTKLGYRFKKPGRSSGMQLKGFIDDKEFQFGNNLLSAKEKDFYANFIYADIIGNSNHKIKTGLNYTFNQLDNQFTDIGYNWTNNNFGAFTEYNYKPTHKFSLITGVRFDYSTTWGSVFTPRLHGRYELTENDVIRFSGGLGTKTPNPFLDNIGVFASSRTIELQGKLEQGQAWNYGINYTKKGKLRERPVTLSLDFYRTDFINKLITDFDISSKSIVFYNLQNGSYANSFMSQVIAEPTKNFEFTVAYRLYDVQSKFNDGGFIRNPLNPIHRAFFNSDLNFYKNWNWDLTVTWNGSSRIPNTDQNTEQWQLADKADPFWLINSQIKLNPSKSWTFYLGAENLFNFQQPNPILDPSNPFDDDFDASLIWGPVFGRKIYSGIKFKI